jgi:hypothetical protein
MKKIYASFIALLFTSFAFAQTICNPTGNLLIFSNYDGGTLNINLDAPMSNIKIGVLSYEGVNINISGIGASAVTAVAYVGFNANNAHCGSVINTNITGTPGGSVNTITFAPPASFSNPNGNPNMICAYSCSTTTNQGGCNTVDQVEDYFMDLFPGSTIFMHKVQYGCWSGTQNVSNGGTCCSLTTGISNSDEEKSISVFPNPATNNLTLSFTTAVNKATIRILNVAGQIIKEINSVSGNNVMIDVATFPAGVYFVETTNEGAVTHTRFIKE